MNAFLNTVIVPQDSQRVLGLSPNVYWDPAPVKDKNIVIERTIAPHCRIAGVSSYSLTSNASAASREIAKLFAYRESPLEAVELVRNVCGRNGVPGYMGPSEVVLYGLDVDAPEGTGLTTFIYDFNDQILNEVANDRPAILTEDRELRFLIWELLEQEGVTIDAVRTTLDDLYHAGQGKIYQMSEDQLTAIRDVFPGHSTVVLEWIAVHLRR